MARQYIVRNEQGVMVAKLGYKMFNALLLDATGHWGVDKKGDDRFYIDEDCTYTAHTGAHAMTIYYWEGYSITKD